MSKLWTSRWVPLPVSLTLELTSYCNLRCRMCPKTHHSVNTPENKVMSRETFEQVKAILPSVSNVALSGLWGEALMHPEWYLEMLGELKKHGIQVSTTSNGTLLTDNLARQLVAAGLDRLTISLDAATADTYATIRPPGKMADVARGLEALRDWKKELGRTTPFVELAFVGLRSNIEEFPDFVRQAHRLGANKVVLQALGEYEGVKDESVAEHFKELGQRCFNEAARIAEELRLEIELFPPDQFAEDRQESNMPSDTSALRKECLDPWTTAVATTTGDVLPCCAGTQVLGNLEEQSFADIWRGRDYAELRRTLMTTRPLPMCRACTGRPWAPLSFRKSLQLHARLLGIHANRAFGSSALYRGIKPTLKKLRNVILGSRG